MNYNCQICEYATTRLSSYKKHLATQKHILNTVNTNNSKPIKKQSVINKTSITTYVCEICHQTRNKSNKSRHIRYCTDQNSELLLLRSQLNNQEEVLKQLNNMNKEIDKLKELQKKDNELAI